MAAPVTTRVVRRPLARARCGRGAASSGGCTRPTCCRRSWPRWTSRSRRRSARRCSTAIELDDSRLPASPARLGEAFAGFAAERYGWAVDPERVVLVPDVVSGIAELLDVLTEPGAGVVVNPPVYAPFFATIRGRRPARRRGAARAPTTASGSSTSTRSTRALRRRAAVYLLCNPHNPTGRVLHARRAGARSRSSPRGTA